jgi:ABC-type uncharacterized transport system substrate-binding protein
MRRRTFLAGSLAIVTVPIAAEAQQQSKVPRVGLLWVGPPGRSPFADALRQGLQERGYVEGQNIFFEDRSAVPDYTRLPAVAKELVALKVDVMVITGGTATDAARKATATIPIVMVGNPVEAGQAASLARPGGNVTGLATSSRELIGKRLELLKESRPGLVSVAVLWNSESHTEIGSLRIAEAAARSLGLKVRPMPVNRPEDFEKTFASIAHEHTEAIFPVPSSMFRSHRARIVELARKHRLPGIYEHSGFVDAGGLMSYGPDVVEMFRHAAMYVDKILKGTKPNDLPIEQPTKFDFVVNMKTAKALGLTIPPSLLLRADRVIE